MKIVGSEQPQDVSVTTIVDWGGWWAQCETLLFWMAWDSCCATLVYMLLSLVSFEENAASVQSSAWLDKFRVRPGD